MARCQANSFHSGASPTASMFVLLIYGCTALAAKGSTKMILLWFKSSTVCLLPSVSTLCNATLRLVYFLLFLFILYFHLAVDIPSFSCILYVEIPM